MKHLLRRPISLIADSCALNQRLAALMAAAATGLVLANSAAAPVYRAALSAKIGLPGASLSLLHWINDGLMAIFFLLVGLEIKRELLVGELSSVKRAVLPGIAALGGMVVPAVIYAAFNWNDPATLRAGRFRLRPILRSRSVSSPSWAAVRLRR